MVNVNNLKETIENLQAFGERDSGKKQTDTAEYLYDKLSAFGLTPEYQFYKKKLRNEPDYLEFRNVICLFKGEKYPDEYYVLGAHYDSKIGKNQKIAPGANDNGSGVAVLLEVARLIKAIRKDYSLLIVFFSNEEKGQHGSRAFVQDFIEKNGVTVKGAIIVDMVGFERDNGDIDIATRPKYKWMANYIEKTLHVYTKHTIKKVIDRHCA